MANVSDDWQLNIVGSGEENEINELKLLAKKLNIADKINWHAWQPEAWSYIQKK